MLFDDMSSGVDDPPDGLSFIRPGGRIGEDRADWLKREILPHEPWLRGHLCRKYPGIDTDDVLQATYLRLMAAGDVDHIKDSKPYLYRAAMSEIVQRARRNEVVEFESIDFDAVDWAADEPMIENIIDSRRALQRFYDAMAGLPPRQRMIIELRRIEGLCLRATAERLALSISSVEKLQLRAIRSLNLAMALL